MKNRINIGLFTVGVLIVWSSCDHKKVEEKAQINMPVDSLMAETINEDLNKGFQILASNCFSCHSPDVNRINKIAPTMAAIKEHYITEGVTKADFANAIIEFINDPVEERSIIPQATERFGLMPKFELSEKQIGQIASYIYQTEIEKPDWYAKHYEEEKQKHKIALADFSYTELGKHFVMSTKSTLGKNLKGALKNKGTENAVEFCSERAYPLTDSMAVALHTKIKRVSDKPRNPLNAANESELKYIEVSKQILAKGEGIKPQVKEVNGKMVGYYPILTNKMCLQCHGEPKTQIQSAILEKINSLYPKDMAKGYAENQLRGIWVVEMNKN